ncbi:hypothetical protein BJ508DRAFT_341123 [Ascobolus immersus RN42]|uniref:Uncharacterized protein n=1 Tax=Ascobolus immersus RN42 TaxID=1160509 RepID=A0A3N4IIV6_ASCIM|nr:hypothetical protein BJ508DRAFT_341123 [Ascobolus immersus RN42]
MPISNVPVSAKSSLGPCTPAPPSSRHLTRTTDRRTSKLSIAAITWRQRFRKSRFQLQSHPSIQPYRRNFIPQISYDKEFRELFRLQKRNLSPKTRAADTFEKEPVQAIEHLAPADRIRRAFDEEKDRTQPKAQEGDPSENKEKATTSDKLCPKQNSEHQKEAMDLLPLPEDVTKWTRKNIKEALWRQKLRAKGADPEADAAIETYNGIQEAKKRKKSKGALGETTEQETKDTPAEEKPEETPAEEQPEETLAEEKPEETPAEEKPEETPAEARPDETPAEEKSEETPAEETPQEKSSAAETIQAPKPEVEKPSLPLRNKDLLPLIARSDLETDWREYYIQNRDLILRFLVDYFLVSSRIFKMERETRSKCLSYKFKIRKILVELGLPCNDIEKERVLEIFKDTNPDTMDLLSTSSVCPVFVLARAVIVENESAFIHHREDVSDLYRRIFSACFPGAAFDHIYSTCVAQLYPTYDWLYPKISFPDNTDEGREYKLTLDDVWQFVEDKENSGVFE